MAIIKQDELKRQLMLTLPSSRRLYKERREKQRVNTETIFSLKRDDLKYDSFERRMFLYSTLMSERVFIEYPGKETVREAGKDYPKDACPGLEESSIMRVLDTSFGEIWDVLVWFSEKHFGYLPVLAAVFVHMATMSCYKKQELDRACYNVIIDDDYRSYQLTENQIGCFYQIDFSSDVWDTLNDMFSGVEIKGVSMSFEAFIKYFDVLLMNEDAKYAYREIKNKGISLIDWKFDNGRVNTIGTCLNIISYLNGGIKLSELLDKSQKGRGTMPFPFKKYSSITANIIQ